MVILLHRSRGSREKPMRQHQHIRRIRHSPFGKFTLWRKKGAPAQQHKKVIQLAANCEIPLAREPWPCLTRMTSRRHFFSRRHSYRYSAHGFVATGRASEPRWFNAAFSVNNRMVAAGRQSICSSARLDVIRCWSSSIVLLMSFVSVHRLSSIFHWCSYLSFWMTK